MKSCPISLIVLYACLVLAVILLVKPLTTLAEGTGSAHCGGGRTVTCNAYRCECQDNVGCTGYDAQGNVILNKPCPDEVFYYRD